ncbi:MAG: enoyl-CoA hydratase-related protein [Acidobacteriota bacterium]
MEYEILKLEVTGSTGIITINRPEAMNALNSRFFSEMDAMIGEVKDNDSISCLIITGMGKAFVAGADIAEMVNMESSAAEEFSRNGQNTFRSIEQLEKPVIAAVNGFALGGGCELAMACDFRIASSKAKFGQPEVNLGLIPGFAGTQRLPRLTGLADALYLLMTGDMINAEDALRIGLVQKVMEPEELLDEAKKIAETISSRGPKAVALVKKVVREGFDSGFDTGSALESKEFGSLFGDEGTEGMNAFLEKRKPRWREE